MKKLTDNGIKGLTLQFITGMSGVGFRTTHYQNTINYMKSTENKQQTNPPLLIAGVRKRICDYCGEDHPLMQDNKDGSFTCLPCLNKIDDGNDIDNCMGCDW